MTNFSSDAARFALLPAIWLHVAQLSAAIAQWASGGRIRCCSSFAAWLGRCFVAFAKLAVPIAAASLAFFVLIGALVLAMPELQAAMALHALASFASFASYLPPTLCAFGSLASGDCC